MKASRKKQTVPFRLPTNLDLMAARPLLQDILHLRGKPVTLDASRVERLGAQCLQVLLAAAMAWKADGLSLQCMNFSPAMLDGLTLLGLSPSHLMTEEQTT